MSIQEILTNILTSRINRERTAGTLDADKTKITEILDAFVAGDKITMDQYNTLTALLNQDSAAPTA